MSLTYRVFFVEFDYWIFCAAAARITVARLLFTESILGLIVLFVCFGHKHQLSVNSHCKHAAR